MIKVCHSLQMTLITLYQFHKLLLRVTILFLIKTALLSDLRVFYLIPLTLWQIIAYVY